VAGFAGPYLFGYLNSRMGSFSYGWGLMAALAIIGGLLVLRVPAVPRAAAETTALI
jgi:cyanate permease